MKKFLTIFFTLFIVVISFSAATAGSVLAVPADSDPCSGPNPPPSCHTGSGPGSSTFSIAENFSPANLFNDFGELASDVVLTLTSIAAAACFIFIIIGGIKIVTAGGDSKKLSSAQSTITYAIIGLAVTILAFVILRVVQYLIGSNVPIT